MVFSITSFLLDKLQKRQIDDYVWKSTVCLWFRLNGKLIQVNCRTQNLMNEMFWKYYNVYSSFSLSSSRFKAGNKSKTISENIRTFKILV